MLASSFDNANSSTMATAGVDAETGEPKPGSLAHFKALGADLMNRFPTEAEYKNDSFEQRWTTHFQVAPMVVFWVWEFIQFDCSTDNLLPIHLLYALLFLKLYPLETVLSGMTGRDEDTVRKYIWPCIVEIADLEHEVVRTKHFAKVTGACYCLINHSQFLYVVLFEG